MENFLLGTFHSVGNFPRNGISGIRYFRNSLYPVCVISVWVVLFSKGTP